jgi:FAD/FMN-containing dehydrogenase
VSVRSAQIALPSWGRLPYGASEVIDLFDRTKFPPLPLAGEKQSESPPLPLAGEKQTESPPLPLAGEGGGEGADRAQRAIAYGNGRSYGDVCQNPCGRAFRTRGLDRFIDFDEASGIVHCESGVLLGEIIDLALPRGWFLPVTPGTRFVTVGGAIANDVHGKNHHRAGTFGCHIPEFTLARTDGSRLRCAPQENADLYAATIGGLGLTGVIVDAHLQLRAVPGPWMDVETLPFDSLDAFYALSRESEADWEYTVAWVDCTAPGSQLGRGVFLRANHSRDGARTPPSEHTRRVPVTPPFSLVNGATLRALNLAYREAQLMRRGRSVQYYRGYFYPLDAILDWNRLYGPHGFYQYQSVVPPSDAQSATREMLSAVSDTGTGSVLAVLKTFGAKPSPGMLSFPIEGTTLALDFPEHGERTRKLFDRLDAIVRGAHGRIYPAKDARMPAELFRSGYSRLEEFLPHRDPGVDSAMARRLFPPSPLRGDGRGEGSSPK